MHITPEFAASVIAASCIIFAYALFTAWRRARKAARDLVRRADERQQVRAMVADVESTCHAQARRRVRA